MSDEREQDLEDFMVALRVALQERPNLRIGQLIANSISERPGDRGDLLHIVPDGQLVSCLLRYGREALEAG